MYLYALYLSKAAALELLFYHPHKVVTLLVVAAALYAQLVKLEATDWISSRQPDREILHEIVARENAGAQNHMMSLTEIKAVLDDAAESLVELLRQPEASEGIRAFKAKRLPPWVKEG